MSPVGFEPTISAGERPKTYALNSAATGTGIAVGYLRINRPRQATDMSQCLLCCYREMRSCRGMTHYCSNLFTVNDIGGYS